jgi:heme A synthase
MRWWPSTGRTVFCAAGCGALVLRGACAAARGRASAKHLGPGPAAADRLQLATGLSNVVLQWPIVAALLHSAGAAALVLVLTLLLARSAVPNRPAGRSVRWRGLPRIIRPHGFDLAAPTSAATRWAQYYALTKPRVVQLIVFCAAIGMLLAEPGLPDLAKAVPAVVGIWLVAAAAAAFNCLVEQHIDARMAAHRLAAHGQGAADRLADAAVLGRAVRVPAVPCCGCGSTR